MVGRASLAFAVAVALVSSIGCTALGDPRVSNTGSCANRSYVRVTAERRQLLTSDTTKVVVETFTQGTYAPEVPVELSASGGRFDGGTGPRAELITNGKGFGSAIWRAPSVIGLGRSTRSDRGPWTYTVQALAFDTCVAEIEIRVRR